MWPLHLVRYDSSGQGKVIGETKVSVTTQAFVIDNQGAVIALSFDAGSAPRGAVEVLELR